MYVSLGVDRKVTSTVTHNARLVWHASSTVTGKARLVWHGSSTVTSKVRMVWHVSSTVSGKAGVSNSGRCGQAYILCSVYVQAKLTV